MAPFASVKSNVFVFAETVTIQAQKALFACPSEEDENGDF
jgi:hypothetical protein